MTKEVVHRYLEDLGFGFHNCGCCAVLGGTNVTFGYDYLLFTGVIGAGRFYFGDPDFFAKIEELING